jgi:hypothetical protein
MFPRLPSLTYVHNIARGKVELTYSYKKVGYSADIPEIL